MTPQERLAEIKLINKFASLLYKMQIIDWESLEEFIEPIEETKLEILLSLQKFAKGEA